MEERKKNDNPILTYMQELGALPVESCHAIYCCPEMENHKVDIVNRKSHARMKNVAEGGFSNL